MVVGEKLNRKKKVSIKLHSSASTKERLTTAKGVNKVFTGKGDVEFYNVKF